jgi:tetratricopeptide (TPR) repeat protein
MALDGSLEKAQCESPDQLRPIALRDLLVNEAILASTATTFLQVEAKQKTQSKEVAKASDPEFKPIDAALAKGDLAEAKKQADLLLESQKKKHGKESSQVMETLLGLGEVFEARNKSDDAKDYLKQGLDLGRKIAKEQSGKGGASVEKGMWKEAEDHCEEAAKIYETLYKKFGAKQLGDSALQDMSGNCVVYSALVSRHITYERHTDDEFNAFDKKMMSLAHRAHEIRKVREQLKKEEEPKKE